MKTGGLLLLGALLIIPIIIYFMLGSKPMETTGMSEENTSKEVIYKYAYFAGGCFWCMEGIFEAQDGVKEAIVGYAGGTKDGASYDKVSSGITNHREAVEVVYNPDKISYGELLNLYWRQIDPTDPDGQFADKGFQYTTAIYYSDEGEQSIAEMSREDLGNSGKFGKEIATKILPFTTFFPAEEYHQDYYKKSSIRYNLYKKGSGREGFIEDNWKQDTTVYGEVEAGYHDYSPEKVSEFDGNIVLFFHANWCSTCKGFVDAITDVQFPDDLLILKVDFDTEVGLKTKYQVLTQSSFVQVDNAGNMIKRWIGSKNLDDIVAKVQEKEKTDLSKLTPLQYKVTQEEGTEPPFENAYWDNKKPGIYVDIIDGTPLFSSLDKFDSGTGWPSFTHPIQTGSIAEKTDTRFFMTRTEVRGKDSDSHLGHLFDDGPKEDGGLRYCVNSAALRFVPLENLEAEGYGEYRKLFE